MIQYKRLTKAEAKDFVTEIDQLNQTAFDIQISQWKEHKVEGYDESYVDLRKCIIETYLQYKDSGDYEIDIRVGLCLYAELNTKKGFSTVLANDDDIWRYISCKVFPDITYLRYPEPKKDDIRLNRKRFFSHTRRIWMKTLWWYVHLSWQGTEASTYKVLEKFGVDTIGHLIERTGKGYRLPLYRQLMKEYAEVENRTAKLFNSIQKQNLVNCRTVEPALTDGAESGYVKRLFEQLSL